MPRLARGQVARHSVVRLMVPNSRFLLLTAVAALALVAPFVLSNTYQRELLVMTCIYGIAALSLNMVMGQMGQFSFGHAAIWGLGGYTSAILSLQFGVSVWLAVLAAIGLTGVVGLSVGYVALRRTRGLELAIITFGFGQIVYQITTASRDITGGVAGLSDVPAPSILGVEFRDELSTYFLVLAALVCSIYFVYRFNESKLGRAVRSVRENEELAKSIGVSPVRYYVLTFAMSSGLIGFSGALFAHHLHFITPYSMSVSYMVILVIMVLIGGTGSLWGPVVGAGIWVWVSEVLGNISQELRFLFFGFVLFAMVLLVPRGVVPTLTSLLAPGRLRMSWRGGGPLSLRIPRVGFRARRDVDQTNRRR
jgi:branched-chain amino acid transport system permease protein